VPSKGCIMRKISTVGTPETGQNAQSAEEWLYPMRVVSRVTINSGEGAGGPVCGRITSPASADENEPEGCDHLC
jgi:hypothetical protein